MIEDDLLQEMKVALEAHAAWSWAEHSMPRISTFDEDMELCNYAEFLTQRALALAAGKTWEQAYSGVPHMVIWPSVYISRADQDEARAIVGRLLNDWRTAISSAREPDTHAADELKASSLDEARDVMADNQEAAHV